MTPTPAPTVSAVTIAAYQACHVAVTFRIVDMGAGVAAPSWQSNAPIAYVRDPKTGKEYRVRCSPEIP